MRSRRGSKGSMPEVCHFECSSLVITKFGANFEYRFMYLPFSKTMSAT